MFGRPPTKWGRAPGPAGLREATKQPTCLRPDDALNRVGPVGRFKRLTRQRGAAWSFAVLTDKRRTPGPGRLASLNSCALGGPAPTEETTGCHIDSRMCTPLPVYALPGRTEASPRRRRRAVADGTGRPCDGLDQRHLWCARGAPAVGDPAGNAVERVPADLPGPTVPAAGIASSVSTTAASTPASESALNKRDFSRRSTSACAPLSNSAIRLRSCAQLWERPDDYRTLCRIVSVGRPWIDGLPSQFPMQNPQMCCGNANEGMAEFLH